MLTGTHCRVAAEVYLAMLVTSPLYPCFLAVCGHSARRLSVTSAA
jgi:hypothetical protein